MRLNRRANHPSPRRIQKTLVSGISSEIRILSNRLISNPTKVGDPNCHFLYYDSNQFLHWFVTEQVEEVDTMTTLLQTIKHVTLP
jgi:hypothetical protein